jgi:hypothetical protein
MQVNAALDNLLGGVHSPVALDATSKIYGVVPAVVKAINDTSSAKRHMMGMVQVFFPWLQPEGDQAPIMPWARVCMPTAGKGVGFYTVPQIGDEVCVGFEHGDLHFPYVIGSLWNGKDKIPDPTTPKDSSDVKGGSPGAPTHKTPDLGPDAIGGDKGANKIGFWKSRKGNLIALDDKGGTIRMTPKGGNSVVQMGKDHIQFLQRSAGEIKFFASKTIRLDCQNLEIAATNDITFEAKQNFSSTTFANQTMKAGAKFVGGSKTGFTISCGGSITMTGSAGITISSDAGVSMKASGAVCVTGGGGIQISGKEVGFKASAVISITGLAGVNFGSNSDIAFKAGGPFIGLSNCINLN